MLRVITKISFTQVPSRQWPDRKDTIIYNFSGEYEFESTWRNLTESGSITLPKNIYVKDKTGYRISLAGTNVNIGGFGSTPVFLRGDKVKLEWGYAYFDKRGNEISPTVVLFDGFIAGVTSKKPFVLNIENAMLKLKEVQAFGGNNNFFSGKQYTVETMLAEMIKNAGLDYRVNALTSTSIGDFVVQHETIAQVLERLRKDYHFEAYFRGNELRVGSFVYLPGDVKQPYPVFKFQYYGLGAIVEDDLDYCRRDDVVLSAVARNVIEENTGKITRDGHAKTKKVSLEVLVTLQNGNDNPNVFTVGTGKKIPDKEGGERRTLYFTGAKSNEELVKLATNELKKYYYTGLKGKFTTFGLPYVKHGDYIDIIDPALPERNGRYVVKGVVYKGGIAGLRQTIELDYLIGRLDTNGKFIGL